MRVRISPMVFLTALLIAALIALCWPWISKGQTQDRGEIAISVLGPNNNAAQDLAQRLDAAIPARVTLNTRRFSSNEPMVTIKINSRQEEMVTQTSLKQRIGAIWFDGLMALLNRIIPSWDVIHDPLRETSDEIRQEVRRQLNFDQRNRIETRSFTYSVNNTLYVNDQTLPAQARMSYDFSGILYAYILTVPADGEKYNRYLIGVGLQIENICPIEKPIKLGPPGNDSAFNWWMLVHSYYGDLAMLTTHPWDAYEPGGGYSIPACIDPELKEAAAKKSKAKKTKGQQDDAAVAPPVMKPAVNPQRRYPELAGTKPDITNAAPASTKPSAGNNGGINLEEKMKQCAKLGQKALVEYEDVPVNGKMTKKIRVRCTAW